ncbi:MAG TPA: histidine kinase, partial [Steroidobacteraceae bacterium]
MSASPLERVTPAIATPGRRESAPAAAGVRTSQRSFRPLFGVLTAFWIYVALSNLMYAISMQASFAVMNVHNVFAPWDARVIQHLVLYPLFILSMRGALRTGWQPLWPALPLQLLCALGFAVLASPALVLGEYLTSLSHGESAAAMWHHYMQKEWGTWSGFVAHEVPIWLASITSFLVTYGFGLALVTGFAFYQRLRDSQLRLASAERALTQAHLAALRMQLSPHTLFNLLHTIRGQISWDPAAAQAMVVQLGDLLRRLLNAGEREFSRLADELQFVTLYLELQQRRFADRLTIRVPLREDVARAWVPSLILQPLVENAVVHGLAGHEGPV